MVNSRLHLQMSGAAEMFDQVQFPSPSRTMGEELACNFQKVGTRAHES